MSLKQEILVHFDNVAASVDAANALVREGIAESAIVRIDSASLGKSRGAINWTKHLGRTLAAEDASRYSTILAAGGALLLVRAQDGEAAERAEDILADLRAGAEGGNGDEEEDEEDDEEDDDDEDEDEAEDEDSDDDDSEDEPEDDEPEAEGSDDQPSGRPAVAAIAAEPGDEVLRLASEELEVAKRQVESGKTRVRRFVVEQPAEAEVSLRSETAEVYRRPVSEGGVGETEWDWADNVIEIIEMREEAVVSKVTRVAEEIVIRKGLTERVETIRETVRRQQIAIERLDDSGNLIPETV